LQVDITAAELVGKSVAMSVSSICFKSRLVRRLFSAGESCFLLLVLLEGAACLRVGEG
jgi:hypothetical protein